MAGRSSTPLKTPGQSFPSPPQPSVTPQLSIVPASPPSCGGGRWGQPLQCHSLRKGPANYPQLLLIARRCSAQRAPPSSCGEGSGRLGCWFTVCRMQRGCSGLIAEVMVYLFLIEVLERWVELGVVLWYRFLCRIWCVPVCVCAARWLLERAVGFFCAFCALGFLLVTGFTIIALFWVEETFKVIKSPLNRVLQRHLCAPFKPLQGGGLRCSPGWPVPVLYNPSGEEAGWLVFLGGNPLQALADFWVVSVKFFVRRLLGCPCPGAAHQSTQTLCPREGVGGQGRVGLLVSVPRRALPHVPSEVGRLLLCHQRSNSGVRARRLRAGSVVAAPETFRATRVGARLKQSD